MSAFTPGATLPNPNALRDQAQRLATGAQAVSDASEYPRLALSACREQADALTGLASAIESHGAEIGRSRAGMTGEERREHRAAILRLRAARLRVKAADHFRASHDIGSRIPFGQPILVGHHSERGHRRAIERMHSNDAKSYAASDYAETLRWTPSLGCWQAFRNYRAQETAKAFVSRESTGANQ